MRRKKKIENLSTWDSFTVCNAEDMGFKRKIFYEQWIIEHVILRTLNAGGQVKLEVPDAGGTKRIEVVPTLSRTEIAALIIKKRPHSVIATVLDPDLIGSWNLGRDFDYGIFEKQEGFKRAEFGDEAIIARKVYLAAPAPHQHSPPSQEQKLLQTILAKVNEGSCFMIERSKKQGTSELRSFTGRLADIKYPAKYERHFIERNVDEKEVVRRIVKFQPEFIYLVATRQQKLRSPDYSFGGSSPRWKRNEHWVVPPNFKWRAFRDYVERGQEKVSRQSTLKF